MAGAIACSGDKDGADKAATNVADTKKADKKKSKSSATELPCFTMDQASAIEMKLKPEPYTALWDDEGGFTLTGLEQLDPNGMGAVIIGRKGSMEDMSGSIVSLMVYDGQLVAKYFSDGKAMQEDPNNDNPGEDLNFTWENNRLHIDLPKEFLKSLPAEDVFLMRSTNAASEEDMGLCGKDLTFKNVMVMNGMSEEEIAEMERMKKETEDTFDHIEGGEEIQKQMLDFLIENQPAEGQENN